jgi:hypothetical protein
MSERENKSSPSGTPFAPAELTAKVRQAVEEPKARHNIRIRLEIEGGQHEEHYRFLFATTGGEETEAGLRDNLRNVAVEPKRTKLAGRDITSLLKTIDVEGLVDAARIRPSMPPDSLVGRLHVGDGEQEVIVVFMADREQARSAGYEPPPAVSRVVDEIYRLGAKAVGAKEIRP